jgi:hypothetical protein
LNAQGEYGATLLHIAAANGYLDVLQLLLDVPGINPNLQDENGETPLHCAVSQNQYECVLQLWGKGADHMAVNNLRQKPIVCSEDQTMIRLIQALEKKSGSARKEASGAGPKKYQGSISRRGRKVGAPFTGPLWISASLPRGFCLLSFLLLARPRCPFC